MCSFNFMISVLGSFNTPPYSGPLVSSPLSSGPLGISPSSFGPPVMSPSSFGAFGSLDLSLLLAIHFSQHSLHFFHLSSMSLFCTLLPSLDFFFGHTFAHIFLHFPPFPFPSFIALVSSSSPLSFGPLGISPLS